MMKWQLEEILKIIRDTEDIQDSHESAYTKKQAKIHAYEEIKEVLRNESEHIAN